MDFSKMNDGSGLTADEKIQQEYGGAQVMLLFQLDGQQIPEAFDHDASILPHQHESLDELFPQAHVPVAADAGEAVSEADSLEQRGTALGRSGPAGGSGSGPAWR